MLPSLNESATSKPMPMGDVIIEALRALAPDSSQDQRDSARAQLTSLAVAMGLLANPVRPSK
jgi:hypothetical protein